MKFTGTMIVVQDMEKSRNFYETLLDQNVVMDLGANVAYEGFALQTLESWIDFVGKAEDDINLLKNNNAELYFETDDYDGIFKKFKNFNDFEIEFVHPTKEFPWGQRGIRFYDPDNHIIEVAESLESLVKKFIDEGMSEEDISERTGLPVEVVQDLKN
jgi:catechol 2,3-dioxygenase-like lactoylglutathione lyase family enzyme